MNRKSEPLASPLPAAGSLAGGDRPASLGEGGASCFECWPADSHDGFRYRASAASREDAAEAFSHAYGLRDGETLEVYVATTPGGPGNRFRVTSCGAAGMKVSAS